MQAMLIDICCTSCFQLVRHRVPVDNLGWLRQLGPVERCPVREDYLRGLSQRVVDGHSTPSTVTSSVGALTSFPSTMTSAVDKVFDEDYVDIERRLKIAQVRVSNNTNELLH